MARPKKAAKPEKVLKFTQSEFVTAVRDCVRLKAEAAEYSGRHGARVNLFTEKTGFSRQAFKFLVGLKKLDDDLKAQNILDEIIMGFELLGFNDQGRLFERVQQRTADKVAPDKGADGANVVAFQKDAVPLGDVAKKLTANNAKAAAKKDAKAKVEPVKGMTKKAKAAAAAAASAPLGTLSEHLPGPGAESDDEWENK